MYSYQERGRRSGQTLFPYLHPNRHMSLKRNAKKSVAGNNRSYNLTSKLVYLFYLTHFKFYVRLEHPCLQAT